MELSNDLIAAIRNDVDYARQNLAGLKAKQDNHDAVKLYFIERLELAIENASGCVLVGQAQLGHPLSIITRSLFELMIVTFWAASDPERAKFASDAKSAEFARILKNLLTKGHGRIRNLKTGTDHTDEIIEEAQKRFIRPKKQIAEIARECELGGLYDRYYGIQSMPVHGHDLGLTSAGNTEGMAAMVSLVGASLQAINGIVTNRLADGRQTTLAELDYWLKAGLVRPDDKSGH